MRQYFGRTGSTTVLVNRRPLSLKWEGVGKDVPFAWGDRSDRAFNLACAIMVHEYGTDPSRYPISCDTFLEHVIACTPSDQPFELTSDEVRQRVQRLAALGVDPEPKRHTIQAMSGGVLEAARAKSSVMSLLLRF